VNLLPNSEYPDYQLFYEESLAEGLGEYEARGKAFRLANLMGAPTPPPEPSTRPHVTYSNDKCLFCSLPYPPHYYGYVSHEMVWPVGVTV
jgi:hypothetical protein